MIPQRDAPPTASWFNDSLRPSGVDDEAPRRPARRDPDLCPMHQLSADRASPPWESPRQATQPANGLCDRLVRGSKSTSDRRVAQTELSKVKGFGSDPLVDCWLLNPQNRDSDEHSREGANSFRTRRRLGQRPRPATAVSVLSTRSTLSFDAPSGGRADPRRGGQPPQALVEGEPALGEPVARADRDRQAAVGISDGGSRQKRISDVAVAAGPRQPDIATCGTRPAGGTTPPSPRDGERVGCTAAGSTSSSAAGSRSAAPCHC